MRPFRSSCRPVALLPFLGLSALAILFLAKGPLHAKTSLRGIQAAANSQSPAGDENGQLATTRLFSLLLSEAGGIVELNKWNRPAWCGLTRKSPMNRSYQGFQCLEEEIPFSASRNRLVLSSFLCCSSKGWMVEFSAPAVVQQKMTTTPATTRWPRQTTWRHVNCAWASRGFICYHQ